MTDKMKPLSSTPTAQIIKHYEDMSAADIAAELASKGLDPRPTIEAVTRLVHGKLDEWRRGGLHAEKTMNTAAGFSRAVPVTPPASRLTPRPYFHLPPPPSVIPGIFREH
jgi:hypothetical protein